MLRRLIWAIAGLLVFVIFGSYLLPSEAKIARSIEIAAPPAKVFDLLNGYKRYNEWSPWYARDPQAKYTLAGPETGKGARMSWVSQKDDVGSGSQEIMEAVPAKLVRNKLDFGDMGTAEASFHLEPAGSGTKVTWDFTSDLGSNPVSRWMGLMFDGWIGPDYEKGLANLKKVAEKP